MRLNHIHNCTASITCKNVILFLIQLDEKWNKITK